MFGSKVLLSLSIVTLVGLAACGGGGSDAETPSQSEAVTLNIPDPVAPVAADVTIGGAFEGDTGTPPADIEPAEGPNIVFRDADSNRLTAAEISLAPAFDLNGFVLAFDRVRAAQPNLATSSDEFARAIVADLAQATAIRGSQPLAVRNTTSGAYDMFVGLTEAEKALILTNPLKAYKSRTAAEEAVAATTALFTGSAYLTRADAFRHSYWNWLMSQCCTVAWATAFATAHESEVPNDDDKRMDLNNNMVGRRLFIKSPTSTPSEAQAALLDYKLLWINAKQKNVTVGIDYLVYLEPTQSVTVFDDGPVYDDIYDVLVAGINVGETPAGGSKAFEFNQIPSGDHTLDIACKLDGTNGGCGFQILLRGALTLPSGASSTSQIVIQQSQTHNTMLTFPTMKTARTN